MLNRDDECFPPIRLTTTPVESRALDFIAVAVSQTHSLAYFEREEGAERGSEKVTAVVRARRNAHLS